MTAKLDSMGGYLTMVLATLALAGVVFFVGMTEGQIPVENLLVVRGAVFLLFLGPWAFRNWAEAKGVNRRVLFARGVAGILTQACTITAATRIPVSLASLLQKTAPLWVFFLAWVVMGVRPLALEFLALPLAAVGLWMLAHPVGTLSLGTLSNTGLAAGLGSGLFNALEILTLRHLRTTDRPNTINFWYACLTAAVALPLTFDGGWPDTPELWGCAIMYSLCALVGQSLLAQATRSLTAVETSIGTLLKPIFAGILGWIFLHQVLGVHDLVGMGLVLLAAGGASVAEAFRKKERNG